MKRQKHPFIILLFAIILPSFLFISTELGLCDEKNYPSKPIKIIVGYGAGGSTDLAARILASTIPEFMGQPLVVYNHPGGSGSISFDEIRKAKPNGYKMLMSTIGQVVLYPALNTKLPFNYDEISYIARTQVTPNMLIVSAKSPWKTFEDLKKALKENPDKYKYGTAGLGAVTHLGPVLLLKDLGLDINDAAPVHFDSDPEGIMSMVRGETHFFQGNLASISSSLKGGLVRGLAVTTPERVPGYDQVPTYTELGHPNIDIVAWRGVAGPPNLPDNVVKTWEEAIFKTLQTKPWKKLTSRLGDEPGYLNSKECTDYVHKQFKKYRNLFSELGLLIK